MTCTIYTYIQYMLYGRIPVDVFYMDLQTLAAGVVPLFLIHFLN